MPTFARNREADIMKKKILIICAILLLILIIPIPAIQSKDGGTKRYEALTYKVVAWHRFYDDDKIFEKTSIYFFPESQLSLDELFELEMQKLRES